MRNIFILLLALTPAAYHVPVAAGETKSDGAVSIAVLRNAPVKVVLNGRSLSLDASLWRDFMPTVPATPDGKPMVGALAVTAADGKAFTAGVRVDRAWILSGEQVWEAPALEEQDAGDPSYKDASGKYANRPDSRAFRVIVRNGPKWGPHIFVDVVVRLTDGKGRHYLLAARKVGIGRVD